MPLPENPKQRFGNKKPMVGLIPGSAAAIASLALRNGAFDKKYGPFNWRETPVEAMTYVHAAIRHIYAWVDGEENSSDTDPPVPHLGHALASLMILVDAQQAGMLVDNRPRLGRYPEVEQKYERGQETVQPRSVTERRSGVQRRVLVGNEMRDRLYALGHYGNRGSGGDRRKPAVQPERRSGLQRRTIRGEEMKRHLTAIVGHGKGRRRNVVDRRMG